MSLILLVEQEGPIAEQVRRALSAEGRRVEVVTEAPEAQRFAREDTPELVVVGEVEGRSELLTGLSSHGGGPGTLALVGKGATAPPEVDGHLDLPCSDEQLRLTVRGCLARLKGQAARSAAAAAASAGDQLTSEQLFGDVLAEVEREVGGAPAQARPRTKAPAASLRGQDEVGRRLEQTLSGVLGSAPSPSPDAGQGSASRRPPRPDTGVDDLLNKTLTGLGMTPKLPGRGEAKAAPAPPVAAAPKPPPPSPVPIAPEPQSQVTEPPVAAEAAHQRPGAAPIPPSAPESRPGESAAPPEELTGPKAAPEPLPPPPDSPPPAAEGPLAGPAVGAQAQETYETQRIAAITEPPAEKRRELGPYTLLERVAVGGMAEVWKARMQGVEGFQKTVAIKRILPQLTDSVEFVTMFIDEAKLAAQLNHPHIIHIYDLGKLEDDYYIAMEYVEGKDLRSILEAGRQQNRPLPMGLALLTASRLASALDHAHRKRGFDDRELGLVHRDVSPQNVLISYEGDIKLCDFGIVKAVAKASKTQMGALKGKLQYMSPEQAWGRVVDSRSDIFSLGAVLFEMLTGERLFAGDSEISVLEAVREARIRQPREVDPSLPEEVEKILTRALARDPEERYQSAGAMQKELDALLYGIKPAPTQADLARHMGDLFAAGAQEKEANPTADPVAAAAGSSPSAAGQELEAVAPAPGLDGVRQERQGSWGLWAAAAAAVLAVLLAGGLFAYRSLGERPEAAPAVAAVDALEAPARRPGESPTAALRQEPELDEPALDNEVDLEQLVDSELRPREEEMRRQFEEERQRLERELEQVEAPPAPPQEDEEPSPEPQPAPEAAAPTPAEVTPASAPEVAAAPGTEAEGAEAPSPPPPAPDAETAVAAQPPPPAAEPQPPPAMEAQTAPEPTAPNRPVVREGDLVDMTTPGLVPPRRTDMRQPTYPPQARRLGREGTVMVRVLVDERGQVLEAELAGEEAGFGMDQAALSAARTARYDPATVEGVPVRVWVTLTFPFRL